MNSLERLATAGELFLNGFDRSCPDKRIRFAVPDFKKFMNAGLQVCDTEESVAPNRFAGQFSKPALDQIQPTGARRNEMHHESRMPLQPCLYPGMLVSGIVVQNQVKWNITWELAIDDTQEFEEFQMTMP